MTDIQIISGQALFLFAIGIVFSKQASNTTPTASGRRVLDESSP